MLENGEEGCGIWYVFLLGINRLLNGFSIGFRGGDRGFVVLKFGSFI